MERQLLLVGASVRAAAFSARRAGLIPFCVDMFADVDLQQRATCIQARPFPEATVKCARAFPPVPLVYTGALENYPHILVRLAQGRSLLGNGARVVRAVRDPFLVARAYASAGLAHPAVRRSADNLPQDGSWLRKPLRGGNGTGIERWVGPSAEKGDSQPQGTAAYYQAFLEGTACSAVFVAADGGASVLLGATQQIIGATWTGASGFRYAGSIGPLCLSAEDQVVWESIGQQLAATFGLAGLFGVDAILHDGAIWPIEVNPRYTASVEVLERALDLRALRYHVDACLSGRLPPALSLGTGLFCGKAVLYARCDFAVPSQLHQLAEKLNADDRRPSVADIPAVGTNMVQGHPVLTVLAEAGRFEDVRPALCALATRIERALYAAAQR